MIVPTKEWKVRERVGIAQLVDQADIVVTATVKNAELCTAPGSMSLVLHPPIGIKLACGSLRVIQVLRGDPSATEIDVLYFDHRTPAFGGLLRRMPVGRSGSGGIYFLNQRRGRVWASVAETRSYVPINPSKYLTYASPTSIKESIAANILANASEEESNAVSAVSNLAYATRLTSLYQVVSTLEWQARSADISAAVVACTALTAHLNKISACSGELKLRRGVSTEQIGSLELADEEGQRGVRRLEVTLANPAPIVLAGFLTSAPGGACEFVHLQLHHHLGSIRALAAARLLDTCRSVDGVGASMIGNVTTIKPPE